MIEFEFLEVEIPGFDSEFFVLTVSQLLNKEGFNSIEDYKEIHSKNKLSEKTILLKGSRGIALELLIPYL